MNTDGIMTSIRNDWRTPRWVAASAAAVLNGIDLDPCGSPDPQDQTVPARRTIRPPADGLALPWGTGTVFMNPPYGSEIVSWVDTYVENCRLALTTVGLALVPARTDTRWWRKLTDRAAAILFFHGRLHFNDDPRSAATFPSALVLHALPVFRQEAVERLAVTFAADGAVYLPRPVARPMVQKP